MVAVSVLIDRNYVLTICLKQISRDSIFGINNFAVSDGDLKQHLQHYLIHPYCFPATLRIVYECEYRMGLQPCIHIR
jgi:hypothetical protein